MFYVKIIDQYGQIKTEVPLLPSNGVNAHCVAISLTDWPEADGHVFPEVSVDGKLYEQVLWEDSLEPIELDTPGIFVMDTMNAMLRLRCEGEEADFETLRGHIK